MAHATDKSNIIMPEGGFNCTKTFEPNMMFFTDAEGQEHKIHMPKGTFKAALKYFNEKNYGELAKFPVWGWFSKFSSSIIMTIAFFASSNLTIRLFLANQQYQEGDEIDVEAEAEAEAETEAKEQLSVVDVGDRKSCSR